MKKLMLMLIGLVLMSGMLSGCATYKWHKSGASLEQANRDYRQCTYDVGKVVAGILSTPGNGAMAGYQEVVLMIQCMESKGYRRIRVD